MANIFLLLIIIICYSNASFGLDAYNDNTIYDEQNSYSDNETGNSAVITETENMENELQCRSAGLTTNNHEMGRQKQVEFTDIPLFSAIRRLASARWDIEVDSQLDMVVSLHGKYDWSAAMQELGEMTGTCVSVDWNTNQINVTQF